jgi:rhamnulose-1-phosphate aldolase
MSARLDHWLWEIGEAGRRLDQLGTLEGAAGNISIFLPRDTGALARQLADRFSERRLLELPAASALPPGLLLVTGTGRRLRDAASHLDSVLCAIAIGSEGAALCRAPGSDVMPTSEIDSHIGVHAVILGGSPAVHAVVHAQPPKLTWLSQIPFYRDAARLNRQLLRWQPETIVALPEGIGLLPFETPGTPRQGVATARAMQNHRLVVWAKHGVIARSPAGPLAAADLIDYAEAAATYEVTDLLAGRLADGLTLAELRAIAHHFNVPADLLESLPEDLLS